MKGRGSATAAVVSALLWVSACAGAVLALGGCASCQSTVRQVALPALAAGSFDGVEADQAAHRIYLADRTNNKVAVVDMSSAKPQFVGTIDVAGTPNGLGLAPRLHRLYAGMADGNLVVVDTDPGSPRAMQVIDKFSVDKTSADLLDYSPGLQRVFVSTGIGGEVVSVDVAGTQPQQRFALKAPVGQPRYDPTDGMLYVTTPSTDSLLKINPADGKVVSTIKLAGCHPYGLAINPGRQLALTTCRSSVAVINLQNHAFDVSRAVAGGDIVTYDAAADRFAVASPHGNGDSTVSAFYGDGHLIGSVSGTPVTHGAAFDAQHGLVYAPAAAGLLSFAPGACEPPPDGLRFAGGMSFFLAPLAVFALFVFLFARHRRRGGPKRLTYEELRKQDMETERERMLELEDSILGPPNHEWRPEA
jgi:DNA-binding beta-propeller fold protein YncE